MKIKTSMEIHNDVFVLCERNEQFDLSTKDLKIKTNKKWVSVDDLLSDLQKDIERGNVIPKGFSAALWISKIKRKLSNPDLKG